MRKIKVLLIFVLMFTSALVYGQDSWLRISGVPICSKTTDFKQGIEAQNWEVCPAEITNEIKPELALLIKDELVNKAKFECYSGTFVGKPAIMSIISYKNVIAYVGITILDTYDINSFNELCNLYISKYGDIVNSQDGDGLKYVQWVTEYEFVELTYTEESLPYNLTIGYGNSEMRLAMFKSDDEAEGYYQEI